MKKGFTLLELLATIAIMAVLIAAVLPFVSNYTAWAKKVTAHRSALIIADAINRYNSLEGASDVSGMTPIVGNEGRGTISQKLLGLVNPVVIDGQNSKFIAQALPTTVILASVSPKVSVDSGISGAPGTASF